MAAIEDRLAKALQDVLGVSFHGKTRCFEERCECGLEEAAIKADAVLEEYKKSKHSKQAKTKKRA